MLLQIKAVAASAGYKIYRNNVLIAQVQASVTSFGDSTSAHMTTYRYTVSAIDGSKTKVPNLPSL